MVFQPICRGADLGIVGYEALARFPEGTAGPEQWFAAAAHSALSGALEGAALLNALNDADALAPEMFLSVNLSSAALAADPLLAEPIRHTAAHRTVVLELTERSEITESDPVLTILDRLRTAGVQVALDDVGTGYSGLRQLITVRPDMLKIDAVLTRAIDTDPLREAIAASLIALADTREMTIVFEGVETDAELHTLRRLGAHLLQGYRLGRPAPLPRTTTGHGISTDAGPIAGTTCSRPGQSD